MIGICDSAPQFELPDQPGNSVALSELLEAGPLMLYFYPADFLHSARSKRGPFKTYGKH